VSYDKVGLTVFNINAYQSQGKDGIFLALLQEGMEVIIRLMME
jgi:hypothetical protein